MEPVPDPPTTDPAPDLEHRNLGVEAPVPISENVNLHQLLQSLQQQLELQQKQLDILQRLAGNGDEKAREEVQTTSPPDSIARMDTQAVESIKERAQKWREDRTPASPEIARLGKDFLEYCMEKKLWWFSDCSPTMRRRLSAFLQENWPENLGKVDGEAFEWTLNCSKHPAYFVNFWFNRNPQSEFGQRGGHRNPSDIRIENNSVIRTKPHWTEPKSSGSFISIGSVDLETQPFPFDIVCFILLQLDFPQVGEWNTPSLLASHLSRWITVTPFTTYRGKLGWAGPLSLTHTVRYFDIVERKPTHHEETLDGVPVSRDFTCFASPDGTSKVYLREERTSVALTTEFTKCFPSFTVLMLAEYNGFLPKIPRKSGMEESGMVGVLYFLATLTSAVDLACSAWKRILSKLDSQLSVTIADLFNDEANHQLMFDNKSFSRSKLYFNVQQLCRVCTGCIEETQRNLHDHYKSFMAKHPDLKPIYFPGYNEEKEKLSVEWLDMMARAESSFIPLLARFNRKREEVESLRDGLFNATSVREASKSTDIAEISVRQNQYVFIFTVATVFYLPLGFVTSVFGMHLYDTTDPDVVNARPKFWITILIISIATYGVSGLGYLSVRKGWKDKWLRSLHWANKEEEGGDMKSDNENSEKNKVEKDNEELLGQWKNRRASGIWRC